MDRHAQPIAAHVDRDLAERGMIGTYLYAVAVGAIGPATGLLDSHPAMMIGFFLNALILGGWRHAVIIQARKREECDPGWRRRFRAIVMLNGMNWAVFASCLALMGATSIPFLMVVIGTAGFSLGGAVSTAPDLRLARAFVVTILVPPAAVCGLAIRGETTSLAVLMVIFILFCFSIARALHREYWDLLRANTELGETAEALRAARDEARSAARAKSDFLANMSHELRTPMNGVIGMADMLLERPLGRSEAEFARIIRASGEQLLMVINDILDYSKLEAGRLELEARAFDVREALVHTLGILAQQAHAKNLELVLQVDPRVPRRIVGDQLRLQQIVLNLVGNAIKFTARGEVVVALARGDARTDPRLELTVRDTGVGIAPGPQDRIFRPFTQADSSTTRRYGGTGLGLSIVHSLVAAMGGRLDLDSSPGRGSAFTASLPLVAGDGDAAAPQPSPAGRIGVVATHAATIAAIELALPDAVVRLDDGTRWRSGRPPEVEVLVVDVARSVADGADAVLAAADAAGVPVVLLGRWDATADGPADGRRRLRKPFGPDALARTVAEAAAGATSAADPVTAGNGEGNGGTGLVLVAEDNPFNQKVILHQLGSLGFEVHVAGDGAEAVAAAAEHDYLAVFMDCRMPVMDGFAATGRIRALDGRRGRVPIVALTANAMAGDAEACLIAGMDRFLSKPVRKEQIRRVLQELDVLPAPVSA